MGLERLDVVLGLAAGAVDILVDGPAPDICEAGDDKARVHPARLRLDAGEDTPDAVPTRRAIIEVLEATQLLAPGLDGAR